MSEYQYYEWQAIDRPLTAAERAAVDKLSSHIEVSASHATVEYNYGDFKHDPEEVLARYFDAFLYFANWGNPRLAFRLPKHLIDVERLQPYLGTECAELKTVGDYCILSFSTPEQDEPDWETNEGDLGTLTPLRYDILQGDLRVLYLAWLLDASLRAGYDDEEEDFSTEVEPPVPPGLGQLSAALEEYIRFMGLDPFLVQAAALTSPALQAKLAPALAAAIAQLPRPEAEDFLRRLLAGEANLGAALQRRLQELAGTAAKPEPAAPRRTLGELQAAAEQLRRDAGRRAQAAAEARRIQELQAFAPQAASAWQSVTDEIERKNAVGYDRAVALLVKLRDLAVYQRELPAFQARLATLLSRYSTLRALQERVQKARLG